MRRTIFALALLIAPLGGCAQLAPLMRGESLAQSAPSASVDAEKALVIAHLAYQGVGAALKQAADSGALHGAAAATAKALYDKAGAALDVADAADAAANAPGVLAAVAAAEIAITQLHELSNR